MFCALLGSLDLVYDVFLVLGVGLLGRFIWLLVCVGLLLCLFDCLCCLLCYVLRLFGVCLLVSLVFSLWECLICLV